MNAEQHAAAHASQSAQYKTKSFVLRICNATRMRPTAINYHPTWLADTWPTAGAAYALPEL